MELITSSVIPNLSDYNIFNLYYIFIAKSIHKKNAEVGNQSIKKVHIYSFEFHSSAYYKKQKKKI